MGKFSPLEKEKIVLEFKSLDIKVKDYCKRRGISESSLRKWVAAYDDNGLEGLVEDEELRQLLRHAKANPQDQLREIITLRIENERLKKGYQVKGGGNKKEFVTIKGKNLK